MTSGRSRPTKEALVRNSEAPHLGLIPVKYYNFKEILSQLNNELRYSNYNQ